MLVLSRRVGEEITLPELGITIRVVKVRSGAASVGVDAPRNLRVLRGELTAFESAEEATDRSFAASA